MRRLIACCLSTGADGVQVLAGDSAMVTLIPQRLGRTVRFAQHQEVYTVWIGPYRLKIAVRIHNAVKTVSVGKTGTLCEDGWLGGLYHTSGGNPGGGWPSAPTPAFSSVGFNFRPASIFRRALRFLLQVDLFVAALHHENEDQQQEPDRQS